MRRQIAFRAFIAAVATSAATVVFGAQVAYLNGSGVTDLSDGAAWDGGIAPGVGDVAVFDGSIPATLTVPAAGVAWGGVVRTNIANAVTFEGGPITIGADGIACFTENADYHRTYLQDVVLAAAQTWTLATNKALYVLGSVTGTGPLSLAADGAYNAVFCGEVEPTGGVVAQSALNVWAIQGSRFAQAPAMAPGAQFLFLPDGTGEVAFRDVVSSGAFANEGIFSFGSYDGTTGNAAPVSPVVTLSAGDSIKGSSTSDSSRDKQVVRVQDTHVVNDGADVTLNSWFYIRSGSWTQLAGDTAFNYAAIVGRGETADYKCKRQRLTLAGGTFKARRMSVGVANAETCPAEVFVTGGSYESTMPNSENWAVALAIGQRVANGETYWDAKKQEDVNLDSQWASGRFEMTGGTVTTPTVFFGNDYDIDGKKDVHTASRFALRGGTLRLGVNGIRPAAYWNAADSRYDCALSGGTFTFYKSFADSKADMYLSDRDGGTSFYTTNGITDTRISGTLYGPGRFRKTGPSTLRLTGSNDYTGRTDVVEGFLYTGSDCAAPFVAVWQADDFFDLGAGTQVGDWANRGGSGTWTFQNAGAITTFNGMGLSMPTVAATTMNGHAELAFDGTRAMFITGSPGSANQPFSEKTEFTVTCVLRVEAGAVGGGSDSWHDSTVVIGCTNPGDNSNIRYGLTLNSDGCLGCGMQIKLTDGGTTNETLWSDTPINDGKPHVVVWTWKLNGKHFLQVDDKSWNRSSALNGKIIKTRLILGANEYAPANTFRGTIADLRMAKSQFSAEARVACARALGLRYGVEAFAAAPEPSAPSEETAPAATATWTAESLVQSDGEAVDAWPEKDGKGASSSTTWTFTRSLADTVLSSKQVSSGYAGSTASPVITRGPDGHKLVSFNGTNACLALTGGADTPVNGAGAMTVAAVVRFTGYGSSGGNFNPKGSATGFFGQSYSPSNRQWLFALSGSARVAAFAEWSNQSGTVTLKSARRFLDDGELHVLVASYPPHGEEGTMHFALDGMMTDAVCTPAKVMGKTRILLGAAEQNSVARYAPVDVAEFRFWKNVAFTPGQMETLTRELCAKYNVYAEGYERGVAADGRQRSREVFVHAGASYGAPVGYDFTLWPEQTVWGDGNIVGRMYVSPGAAVKVTATNTLSAADVEFADGASLKAECAANGAVNELPVTGDLWLPDGTVTVDVSGGEPPPQTSLLTWTGKVRQRGTTEFVPLDPNSRLAFRLDVANRRLVVASSQGTFISIR